MANMDRLRSRLEEAHESDNSSVSKSSTIRPYESGSHQENWARCDESSSSGPSLKRLLQHMGKSEVEEFATCQRDKVSRGEKIDTEWRDAAWTSTAREVILDNQPGPEKYLVPAGMMRDARVEAQNRSYTGEFPLLPKDVPSLFYSEWKVEFLKNPLDAGLRSTPLFREVSCRKPSPADARAFLTEEERKLLDSYAGKVVSRDSVHKDKVTVEEHHAYDLYDLAYQYGSIWVDENVQRMINAKREEFKQDNTKHETHI